MQKSTMVKHLRTSVDCITSNIINLVPGTYTLTAHARQEHLFYDIQVILPKRVYVTIKFLISGGKPIVNRDGQKIV
jgi:hypothetical protein